MKCKSIKKYLYLRDDELTATEKAKVENHIASCIECRKELEEMKAYYIHLKNINSILPVDPEKDSNEDAIVESVIKLNHKSNTEHTQHIFDHLIYRLSGPIVRYALFSILIFIVASFLTQFISTASDINKLESRMNETSLAYSSSENAPGSINLLEEIKNALDLFKGKNNSVKLPSGWMLMKEKSLIDLLNNYNTLRQYSGYVDFSGYPLLRKLNLNDGLDSAELELLLNNRAELEKEMNSIINREIKK